jgi:toxin ParE1/3/4
VIGLGDKFMRALDGTLKQISINPFYQVSYKDYRGLIIKDFPLYQVIFHVNEESLVVYVDAIFLAIQDPAKKPNR